MARAQRSTPTNAACKDLGSLFLDPVTPLTKALLSLVVAVTTFSTGISLSGAYDECVDRRPRPIDSFNC